jgi:hypothetical protein
VILSLVRRKGNVVIVNERNERHLLEPKGAAGQFDKLENHGKSASTA